jgi:hypothetical protein
MKNSEKSTNREKISRLVYIPAIASLIPFIGIPFSISAFLWGISDWKIGGKRPAILASIGFVISVLVLGYFSWAINWFQKSPYLIETKTNYARVGFAHVIRYLEYYKLGHGQYPDTLIELREKDNTYFNQKDFTDPFSYEWITNVGNMGQPYYYVVSKDRKHYNLFSIGPDHKAHTQDDIFPEVLEEYKSVIGLQIDMTQAP